MSKRGRRALPIALMAGLTLAAVSPAAAAVRLGQWQWPVEAPRVVLREFVAPPTRYSAGHRGLDLEADAGRAVFAPSDGVVSYSGTVVDRPVLSLRHDGDLLSSYEPLATTLTTGDAVARGQLLGVVAAGGHCDGRCVHFGVRLHGEYVSPLLLLGGIPRAVLLPLG